MLLLNMLAEQRIEEAMRDGAFDNLPGEGKPLALDDDLLVPEAARVAYRVLKNAGFVPPELETRREIADLHRLIASETADEEQQRRAYARLAVLQAALEAKGRGALLRGEYRIRLLARFGRR